MKGRNAVWDNNRTITRNFISWHSRKARALSCKGTMDWMEWWIQFWIIQLNFGFNFDSKPKADLNKQRTMEPKTSSSSSIKPENLQPFRWWRLIAVLFCFSHYLKKGILFCPDSLVTNWAMAKGYGIIHWIIINLINLQFESIHPANHNMVWYQFYRLLISLL